MASGALFGGSGGRSQSKNLVEFRAGKMFMKGKMVHPDKRKGTVYLNQSDDNLMHFCWKDRTTGTTEDDLIIFPEDAEFKPVPQCTTGRCFLLRFKNSSRKFFFWMQEPKSDKDEENCQKINEYLNNPPTPGSNRSGGGGGGLGNLPPELASGLADSDLQSLLGNMSQQQLMQLLSGMGMGGGGGMGGLGGLSALMGGNRPSSAQSSDSAPPLRVQSSPGPRATTTTASSETPAPARPVTAAALPSQPSTTDSNASSGTTAGTQETTAATPSSQIQLSDLQSILSGMNIPEEQQKETIDLSQALTPDVMIPMLANKDVQEKLIPFLPEGETLPKTEAELRDTVQSPQFQQAMSVFSSALASGQLGPLMGQFGFGEEVTNAAAQGDVEAFVKAVQADKEKVKKEKDEEEK